MPRSNISRKPNKSNKYIATPRRAPASAADLNELFNTTSRRDRLIVSIDYGTTFTSVAYKFLSEGKPERYSSLKARLDGVSLVEKWPGSSDEVSTVPSRLVYASADPRISRTVWVGHRIEEAEDQGEIPLEAKEIELAKLLLHDAKETKEKVRTLKAIADSMGKDPYEFIKLYLFSLRHHLFIGKDEEPGYFMKVHSSWLRNTDIEFIFGVPPAWTMRMCKIRAFTTIFLTDRS